MQLPTGVIIVGLLLIVGGIFGVLWGLILATAGGVSWLAGLVTVEGAVRAWGGGAFLGGLLSMATGVAEIVAGFGLFARQYWAWLLAVIALGVSLISPIIALLNGNWFALFGLIIPGVILFYLLSPHVRRVFEPRTL